MFRKLLVLCLLCVCCYAEDPKVLYLSAMGNPSREMAVHWWGAEGAVSLEVLEGDQWKSIGGSQEQLGSSETFVNTVRIKGLNPGDEVSFRVEKEVYRFRTVREDLTEPERFVVGGDLFVSQGLMEKMNRAVAEKEPAFAVLGGDIAYTKGRGRSIFLGERWEIGRWETFFRIWKAQMRDKQGRLIPIVAVVGNHDVPRWKGDKTRRGQLFYQLFPSDNELSYRMLDVGDSLRLFLLDTGHSVAIEGEQTEWLERALKGTDQPYRMAVYHVGAFASHKRGAKSGTSKTVREQWVPLFEKYGVQVGFEHHIHLYKRTHPIRGGIIDSEGVIYLGDGCWGGKPRSSVFDVEDAWYLAEAKRSNCCFLVEMGEEMKITPFDEMGKQIDQIEPILPKR